MVGITILSTATARTRDKTTNDVRSWGRHTLHKSTIKSLSVLLA